MCKSAPILGWLSAICALQVPFFASKCRLGPNGVEEILGLGKMSPVEEKAVQDLIPILRKNIDTGVEFAKNPPAKK